MNIAFGTFLLFLLVIPGIAFRNAFTFGPYTKRAAKSTAFDDFIWGIIPGIIFQLFGALLVNAIEPFGYSVDFNSLGAILFGPDANASQAFGGIGGHLFPIISYNICLIGFSAFMGYFLRKTIRLFALDHHFKVLRFNNEWHYILKGEFIFFKETDSSLIIPANGTKNFYFRSYQLFVAWLKLQKKLVQKSLTNKKKILCTVYAVVKSQDGTCYTYEGAVYSFSLNKDGSLDFLYLWGVKRSPAIEDNPKNTIENGSIQVIKGSELIDITVKSSSAPHHIDEEAKDPKQFIFNINTSA